MTDRKPLVLDRLVPAHIKRQEFLWCKLDFMPMSQEYRNIREKTKRPMDTCWWCKHKFVDGEMMALACPTKGVNRVLCQTCADQLLESAGGV